MHSRQYVIEMLGEMHDDSARDNYRTCAKRAENIIEPFSRTVSSERLTTIANTHDLLTQLTNAWKNYDVDEDLGEGLATFIWSTLENYRFAQETYHFV